MANHRRLSEDVGVNDELWGTDNEGEKGFGNDPCDAGGIIPGGNNGGKPGGN